jgi:DNA-binding transcriptional ArsR family regulator
LEPALKESPPAIISSVLATAMSHPTRLNALTFLAERPATPKEIAARIGLPINNVAHHINVLLKLGCIELVSVDPVCGGRVAQHLYRAAQKNTYLDGDAWERLGDSEKLGFVATLMRMVSDDLAEAMLHGTFNDPDDNHLSRSPMNVDAEGWQEVVSLLDGTVEGLFEIQERIAARCTEAERETFPIKVEILQFRSPSSKSK